MLTERQNEVVRFIAHWWVEHGYGPSFDDIAAGMVISKTGAVHHVQRLIELGVLVRAPGVARSIRTKGNLRRLGKGA